MFEDALDGSDDEHSVDDDEKEVNEALKELQCLNLKEKKVPLKAVAEIRNGKKLKKNNGENGVNTITDEVRYIVIYYTLYY